MRKIPILSAAISFAFIAPAHADVTVGVQFGTTHLPVVIAAEKGFFQQAGGTGNIETVQVNPTEVGSLFAEGKINASSTGATIILRAYDQSNGRVKLLTGLQKQTTGLYCRSDRNIKSTADFKADTVIASPGANSVPAWDVRMLASEKTGSARTYDKHLRDMPLSEAYAAMSAPEYSGVDCHAATATYSMLYERDSARYVRIVTSPSLSSFAASGLLGFGNTLSALAVDGIWCAENISQCKALYDSIKMAGDWLAERQNRSEAARILMKHPIGKDITTAEEAEEAVFQSVSDNANGACDRERARCINTGQEINGLGHYAAIMFAEGVLSRIPTMENLAPLAAGQDATMPPNERMRDRMESRIQRAK